MNKGRALLLSICLIALLCACGQKTNVDKNTIIINKKGNITEAIVEDFSQPYYNADELKTEIETKVTQYNSEKGSKDSVKLDKFDFKDGKIIKVNISFKSFSDYAAFNEKELFTGTVAQAYDNGYEFPSMKSASEDGTSIEAADIMEMGSNHMLVLEEAQQIIVPGKITYISDGVSLVDEHTAINENVGQKAFLIYE